jgi:hypothetical protein
MSNWRTVTKRPALTPRYMKMKCGRASSCQQNATGSLHARDLPHRLLVLGRRNIRRKAEPHT